MEGTVLGLGFGADDNVDFEKGVEDVDCGGREVGLREGVYFDDLHEMLAGDIVVEGQRETYLFLA